MATMIQDRILSNSLPFYSTNLPTLSNGETITAEFVYNYYTRDEGVSEATSLDGVLRDTDEYDFILENYENNVFPRQVNLTILPPDHPNRATLSEKEILLVNQDIKKFIVYEEAPFNKKYNSIVVNDTSIDEKIYEQINAVTTATTATNTQENFTTDLLNSAKLQSSGIRFSKAQARQEVVDSYANDVKAISLGITINSLFISDMVRSVERWQSSAFTDEYAAAFEECDLSQVQARNIEDPLNVTRQDLEVAIPAYKTVEGVIPDTSLEHVGYIIEKYGEQLDGTTRRYDDVVLWSNDRTDYADTNVRYGAVYKYRLRSLYRAIIQTRSPNNFRKLAAHIIIASTGTFTTTTCIEKIPPNPPNNITFQQTLNGLYIRWNFPINKQKDIKRFQVFRRKSIDESFELIREINFDKTLLPYTSGEIVPDELITTSNGPIKNYLDTDFQKLNSDFIYTLCCIDAHGYSSSYSEQYRVRFDQLNAKLLISRISPEGAPKPYPNVNILGDFFEDLIKSSGPRRVRLYFDPEYPDVIDAGGKSLKLINTSSSDETAYKLVMTEVNLAASQVVDVKLKNKKLSKTGIPPSQARFYTAR